MKKLLFVYFILIVNKAFTQNSLEIEKKLHGGNTRQWQVDTIDPHLSDKCKDGLIIYTFSSNHQLQIKKCINSKWDVSIHSWSVSFKESKAIIYISNKERFEVDFPVKNKKEKLRLKTLTKTKGEIQTDTYFVYVN